MNDFQAATSTANHVARLAMPPACPERSFLNGRDRGCTMYLLLWSTPTVSETDQSAHLHQGLNLTCSGSAKYGPHGLDKVLVPFCSFIQGSPGKISAWARHGWRQQARGRFSHAACQNGHSIPPLSVFSNRAETSCRALRFDCDFASGACSVSSSLRRLCLRPEKHIAHGVYSQSHFGFPCGIFDLLAFGFWSYWISI